MAPWPTASSSPRRTPPPRRLVPRRQPRRHHHGPDGAARRRLDVLGTPVDKDRSDQARADPESGPRRRDLAPRHVAAGQRADDDLGWSSRWCSSGSSAIASRSRSAASRFTWMILADDHPAGRVVTIFDFADSVSPRPRSAGHRAARLLRRGSPERAVLLRHPGVDPRRRLSCCIDVLRTWATRTAVHAAASSAGAIIVGAVAVRAVGHARASLALIPPVRDGAAPPTQAEGARRHEAAADRRRRTVGERRRRGRPQLTDRTDRARLRCSTRSTPPGMDSLSRAEKSRLNELSKKLRSR